MDGLRVAVVSSRSRFCDISANLRHFETLSRRAAGRGARLVCFPELALTSYTIDPRILDIAEKIPGPATDRLAEVAHRLDVYISMGLAERSAGRYYIAQAVVGPDGYLGKYRKYHPTDGERQAGFSPGRSFPTFSVDGFRLGINICFDGRHPDTLQPLSRRKVDIVHHPHGNLVGLGKDAEEWTRGKMVYFVERAIKARAYILINNSAEYAGNPEGELQYGSGAMVLDPLGQVVKRTTQKTRSEKMITVTLEQPLSAIVPEFEMSRIDDRVA